MFPMRPFQSAYVLGRNIIDNLFFAQEAVVWTVEAHLDTAVIILNFLKAFDRISWSFFQGVLQAKGFSNLWIS
jgi:hypothetical protein